MVVAARMARRLLLRLLRRRCLRPQECIISLGLDQWGIAEEEATHTTEIIAAAAVEEVEGVMAGAPWPSVQQG